MEFKESCTVCLADVICNVNFQINGVRCKQFHKLVEEKLKSTPSAEQQLKAEIAKWVSTYPDDISKCDPDDGDYETMYKNLLYDIKRATSAV